MHHAQTIIGRYRGYVNKLIVQPGVRSDISMVLGEVDILVFWLVIWDIFRIQEKIFLGCF